jgi:D-methionine transport system substrate-binding protein
MAQDRRYDIVAVAKTVVFPLGLYGRNIRTAADLRPGATVAIANDPLNGARALQLLAKLGLISLRPDAGLRASIADITDNPHRLRLVEVDIVQLAAALNSVDLAAINVNFALEAGLQPTRDALAYEDAASPYANVIAVRVKDKDNPAVEKFIRAYQSEPVRQFIREHFQGRVLPAW